jgi:hypothetical protein
MNKYQIPYNCNTTSGTNKNKIPRQSTYKEQNRPQNALRPHWHSCNMTRKRSERPTGRLPARPSFRREYSMADGRHRIFDVNTPACQATADCPSTPKATADSGRRVRDSRTNPRIETRVSLHAGTSNEPTKYSYRNDKHIHTLKYIRTFVHTCIHTYVHTYIHTYMHTYTHIRTYVHTYIHTYVHTYIHTCMHTYTHTYMHTYTHIHTYVHTYIYTHTYVHTHIHTYITYIHSMDP